MRNKWLLPLCLFVVLFNAGCQSLTLPEKERARLNTQSPKSVVVGQDLSGRWEYREGEIVYELLLDRNGNGRYEWQQGQFETTELSADRWRGQWIQTGNDREGRFEARLSANGMSAQGRWWYTRIGDDADPLEHGGKFTLTRMEPMVKGMSMAP